MERSNHHLRLGLLTDAMPERSLDEVIRWAGQTGLIQDLEIGTGGYSPSPHCNAKDLLSRAGSPKEWRQAFDRAELGISALNVSGNPLHPDPEIAHRHDADLRRAVLLAAELGVKRIVAMSGCPGAADSDRSAPHFSGGGWLPDLERIAEWQWSERVLPYWSEIAEFAGSEHPDLMICFELHPGTFVYNLDTFNQMRPVGSNLGVNLDPSHLFWQSMDPLALVGELGDRIGHVHGKDTRLNMRQLALNGVLDNRWPNPPDEMPWNFATVGRGHEMEWWRSFVGLLRDTGFEGTISIEYEDPFVAAEESVLESAQLLSALNGT